MSRTILNFWLDVSLLLIFLTLIWCSVITQFVFPPANTSAGWTLWGWTFEQWRGFQFGMFCVMSLAVLLHVMLHWNWVCGVITSKLTRVKNKPDEGTKTLYGVGLLIVILNVIGIAIAAAAVMIRSPAL